MVQPDAEKPENASRNNRRVVFGCLAALAVMTAITAVSPKLYSHVLSGDWLRRHDAARRSQCRQGSGSRLHRAFRRQRGIAPSWKFEPDVTTMKVKIGETALAFFRATNMSDKPCDRSGGVQRRAARRWGSTSRRSNASASRSRR